ncbi:hypothetical protein FGO68_gene4117 [Halteria grandinella]|uniref:Uncharacterized protein n=1 Tax=Halteria grandinella TaxID=5974 RepID=A0A8J8SXL4_HALGN|nr:hypothetical protein FGO68_gene4117 [Halteria grandinella]
MEKDDALKIMMLKAEQQINTIHFLNKSLELSNNEKQELRMQVRIYRLIKLLSLNNDNLILRREKDSLSFQAQQLQNQIDHLQQQDQKIAQTSEKNSSDQQNSKLTPSYLFLQQEYQKVMEDNSQLKIILQELRNSLQSEQLLNQSLKFENEKQMTDIKHYQDIIKYKEKHLLNLELQLKCQQEAYQEQIDSLSSKLFFQKQNLLQQPQFLQDNHPESTLIQQYQEKYELIKLEYEKLLQQLNNEPVNLQQTLVNFNRKGLK